MTTTPAQEMAAAQAAALRLEADHAAALATRWVQVWDALAPEYQATLTDALAAADDTGWVSARTLRGSRLEQALALTRERLVELVDGDVVLAAQTTLPVMQAMVDGSTAAILTQPVAAGQAGVVVAWDAMNTRALDAIVARTTGRIESKAKRLPDDVVRLMRDELTRGVAVGDNPRTTARRMTTKAGDRFLGGRNRALNIARTEMLDASRAAQQAHDAANTDVLKGWQWLASLDRRCCAGCLSMHGRMFDLDEPGPLGHQSCRCARVPVTKTWADLGIPGMADDPLPVDPGEGQRFFDDLAEDSKLQAMGGSRKRLDAYQSGDLAWDDLAVRRTTKGWRDSYVMPSAAGL